MQLKKSDPFLDKYLERYDQWLGAGDISYASKVVPVRESITAQQWVIPSEQALEILSGAETVALADCVCRSHYKRCDHPLDVCILLDEVAVKFVAKQNARPVSLKAAEAVLKNADKRGLVHLSFYMPGNKIYAFCSCCDCCCHDLQLMRLYGRSDIIARSEYVVTTDIEACSDCGACIDRCFFGARIWHEDKMTYNPDACYGCGLCVTVCPEEATKLRKKEK
jgi:Pyruvate/2-oxoacid:ferredoxin oxidoreductase delta subunit